MSVVCYNLQYNIYKQVLFHAELYSLKEDEGLSFNGVYTVKIVMIYHKIGQVILGAPRDVLELSKAALAQAGFLGQSWFQGKQAKQGSIVLEVFLAERQVSLAYHSFMKSNKHTWWRARGGEQPPPSLPMLEVAEGRELRTQH